MNKFFFCTDKKKNSMGQGYCPAKGDIVAHLTEFTINDRLIIPEPKPGARKIVTKHHTIEIIKALAVDAEQCLNGQHIEGKKIMVAGVLQLGIEYESVQCDHQIHFVDFKVPFNGLIFCCCNNQERLFPENFQIDDFLVHACVEHIEVEIVAERILEKVIVMMLWLQPKTGLLWAEGGM